jgi:hypothetical protein
MGISYDSTRAITVCKCSDQLSVVNMYSLSEQTMSFEENIGGGPNQAIKVKEVEQNAAGNFYAVVYMDDGKFRLRTFGKTTRTQEEIDANEVEFNGLLGLDDYTMANADFPDPFITCCFISDEKIFVNLFHNYSLTHYHFIWDLKKRRLIGKPSINKKGQDSAVSKKICDCNTKNFPYKCFYNEEKNQVYSFYRQGQAFCINPDNLEDFRFERMTEMDLGQMVLIYGEALVARSSSRVLFFRQEYDKVLCVTKWVLYHQIRARGMIFFIKGNVRI